MGIPENIRFHYPYPIAKLYEGMCLETEPRQRIRKLVDLFERTTQYLVLVGLASYQQQGLSDPKAEELLAKIPPPPTLPAVGGDPLCSQYLPKMLDITSINLLDISHLPCYTGLRTCVPWHSSRVRCIGQTSSLSTAHAAVLGSVYSMLFCATFSTTPAFRRAKGDGLPY
jgi:hypothetical protein